MQIAYQVYIGVLAVSMAISVALIGRLWQLRRSPGSFGLMLALLCVAEWSLTYALEIGMTDMGEKIFWAKMQFIGIPFAPLGLFIFAMHYTGRSQWLTRLRLALLSVPGIITILLAFTNEAHNQIWTEIAFTDGIPFGPLNLGHGTWFFIETAFLYVLIVISTAYFFQVSLQGNNLYQGQSRLMLAGMMVPWVVNFFYVTKLSPFPALDLTPVAFSITNIAISAALLLYRMVDLLPVAHSTMFAALADGVLVFDGRERLVDINPAAQKILQRTSKALGATAAAMFDTWGKWKDETGIQGRLDEYQSGALTFEIHATPIFDKQRQRTGSILVFSDITELKRANEQMREASRLKTQLLANVSHDLRTPLGAIIGYSEMLKEGMLGNLSGEQRDASAEILDSANQLLAFVDNLIGQAQVETGRIMINERPFQVREIIEPLLSTFNYHASKKGIHLTQSTDPTLPEKVIGDIYWLRQVLFNLVNNAIKFTEQGGIHIHFFRLDEGAWSIEIRDTGIGIGDEDRERIFEAFERAADPQARRQAGSGLGLSIVRQLTDLMGGRIELHSEPGRGSTFKIILPLKLPAEEINP
jgi:signal transduction histidine kinase